MQASPRSVCTFCRHVRVRDSPRRLLSTTTPRAAIPPESPRYIDIPASYQERLIIPRRAKGKLPVPRNIFPRRSPDKTTPEYIRAVTPDRLPHNQPADPSTLPLAAQHRRRMGALRKSHLRTALPWLASRQARITDEISAVSNAKQLERARLLSQPPLPSDRLTSSSIPASLHLTKTGPPTYANPSLIHARKLTNIANHDLFGPRMTSGRQLSLHTLYMNARSFITNESQLDAAIDREFPADGSPSKSWRTQERPGTSIWNKGPPKGVKTMLEESVEGSGDNGGLKGMGAAGGARAGASRYTGALGRVVEDQRATALHRKDQERMRRIAEELSGGKM